jgi:MFS family permease
MQEAKSRNILLWLAAVGFFMQTLDATIVNTALPAMAHSLGESPLRMQAVVVSYALAMAMLIPASGWLTDRFGTRRVFFSALLLFSIGSLLCAYSPSLTFLVLARVVQGIGGAMLATFVCMGLITAASAGIFAQLMLEAQTEKVQHEPVADEVS